MNLLVNFNEFEAIVDSYNLTDKQTLKLYKNYLILNRKKINYDIEALLMDFDHAYEVLINEGYKEEEVTDILARRIICFRSDLEVKLLILETVSKKEKDQIVLHDCTVLQFSTSHFYAKTRLWRDLGKPLSYDHFMRLNKAEIEKEYGYNDKELKAKYPINKNTLKLLTSRKKTNQIIREREKQKVLIK